MTKNAKTVVRNFYLSPILKDATIIDAFFDKDIELIWNSASGLSILRYEELKNFFAETRRTYSDLRVEVSHLLSDDDHVTIRYKAYIRTIENPEEELGIAHFISIWQVKEGKIYKGHTVSQPVTPQDDTTESYHKVKL